MKLTCLLLTFATSFAIAAPAPGIVAPPALPWGAGGPDTYGYKWVDSDEPGGPVYSWQEIRSTGTVPGYGDDPLWGPFALPGNFTFYGNTYNQVYICANGWVTFTYIYLGYFYPFDIPSSNYQNNQCSPYGTDLYPTGGANGTVYYRTQGSQFIVEWDSVSIYPDAGTNNAKYKFEVILNCADNVITFQYKYASTWPDPLDRDGYGITGIENIDGSIGLKVSNDLLKDQYAIKFWRPVNDVSADTILVPGSTCPSSSDIIPKVRTSNCGSASQTYPLRLQVKSGASIVYDKTQNVSLGPFTTTDVTFPSWHTGGPGIVYDLTAFVTLPGDEDPSNDTTRSKTTTIMGNDVGVDAIISPPDTVDVGVPVVPSAVYTNYGRNPADFAAECVIQFGATSVYSNVVLLSLEVDDSRTVDFAEWTPESTGVHLVTCRVDYDDDEDPDNDELTKLVYVRGAQDAGVIQLGLPTQAKVGEAIQPVVVVQNFGAGTIRGLPVSCVVNYGGGSIYAEQNTIDQLPAGGTWADTFPSWTPKEAGSYEVVGFTALPGDINPANDTARAQLTATGIEEPGASPVLRPTVITSNPVRDRVVIACATPARVVIYDAGGRVARSLALPSARGYARHTLFLTPRALFPPGIYFLAVESAPGTLTHKLVVTR